MLTKALVPATTYLLMAAGLMAAGCATSPVGELNANENLVREFTKAANSADWDGLARIVAEDFTRHSAATAGPPITSRNAFIELQKGFITTFPDQHVRLEQVVSEGDLVAALATYSGTQTGPMGDLKPTGKAVQSPILLMFRIESRQIAELWVEWDNVAMLTQLGLFPATSQADLQGLAKRYFRGVYGCDPSVVDELASDDVVISYPIFATLFGKPALRGRDAVKKFAGRFCKKWNDAEFQFHEAISDRDRIVLVWSFTAKLVEGETSEERRSWGGISLFRFGQDGKIIEEVGEESDPGPFRRLEERVAE